MLSKLGGNAWVMTEVDTDVELIHPQGKSPP